MAAMDSRVSALSPPTAAPRPASPRPAAPRIEEA